MKPLQLVHAGVLEREARAVDEVHDGILPAPPRAENGYRDYGEIDLCRARLVVSLRGLGLDLAEAGRMAELCSTGRCEEMVGDLAVSVADRRLAVAAAMSELAHVDAELASVERALATGESATTLCLRKEVC